MVNFFTLLQNSRSCKFILEWQYEIMQSNDKCDCTLRVNKITLRIWSHLSLYGKTQSFQEKSTQTEIFCEVKHFLTWMSHPIKLYVSLYVTFTNLKQPVCTVGLGLETSDQSVLHILLTKDNGPSWLLAFASLTSPLVLSMWAEKNDAIRSAQEYASLQPSKILLESTSWQFSNYSPPSSPVEKYYIAIIRVPM